MTKVKKVIHVSTRGYTGYFPNSSEPDYFSTGWANTQAEACVKVFPDIPHEVWRPEKDVTEIVEGIFHNVKAKLFPTNSLFQRYRLFPVNLLLALLRETKNHAVVFNLHSIHTLQAMIFIFVFRNYPIIIHHHGDIPIRKLRRKGSKRVIDFVLGWFDIHSLKYVDHFSVISKTEMQYLTSYVDNEIVVLEQGRKFYNEYRPIEKKTARELIGLPQNQKLILYVGYYYSLKGVNAILNVFNRLKMEMNVSLLLIGGSEKDELYHDVIDSGALHFGFVENQRLIEFFSSVDVYITGAFDNSWVEYGGISTSIIEALSCNVPVVSAQLKNYSSSNVTLVGEIPTDEEDLYLKVKKVLMYPDNYQPRLASIKHYDFEEIIRRNQKVYMSLFLKYYGY